MGQGRRAVRTLRLDDLLEVGGGFSAPRTIQETLQTILKHGPVAFVGHYEVNPGSSPVVPECQRRTGQVEFSPQAF